MNLTKFVEPKLGLADVARFLDISVQAIHKRLKEKGIRCPKVGNKSYVNYNVSKQLLDLKFKPKKVAMQLVKGGVGKTTCLMNIAACANALGAKILLIDIDPQGNLTDSCGVNPDRSPVLIDVLRDDEEIKDTVISLADGLDILPSRIENVMIDSTLISQRLPIDKIFKKILRNLESNYDFILIDCPPTLSHSVTGASLYADLLVSPLNPDRFSEKGLQILKEEIQTLNENYSRNIEFRVFLNKFSSKTILSDRAIDILNDDALRENAFTTTIPYAQEIPNITGDDKNLFSTLKKSVTRGDFFDLTMEIFNILPSDQKSTPKPKAGFTEKA